MILILSNPVFQSSIDDVISWLRYLGEKFIRINGLNPDEVSSFSLGIHNRGTEEEIRVGEQKINPADIKAVWLYRWYYPSNYGTPFFHESLEPVKHNIFNRIIREKDVVDNYFFHLLRDKFWLSRPHSGVINKLIALKRASECGLDIPATAVVSQKAEVEAFREKYPSVISKPLYELIHFPLDNYTYSSFTAELSSPEDIPGHFAPSLIQEKIEKQFEIRSFYLDGEFYSMAIFSQNDQQTQVDFRRYNRRKPNRNVPYRLPGRVTASLKKLMAEYELNTASVDLIRSADGRYLFLEINPVGQFGMTSVPCNYFLEKKVALALVKHGK